MALIYEKKINKKNAEEILLSNFQCVGIATQGLHLKWLAKNK